MILSNTKYLFPIRLGTAEISASAPQLYLTARLRTCLTETTVLESGQYDPCYKHSMDVVYIIHHSVEFTRFRAARQPLLPVEKVAPMQYRLLFDIIYMF